MLSVREATISGFNEQVQAIKESASEDGKDFIASLVTFNGKVDEVFWNKPVSSLEEITKEDYDPLGTTALYDAVGGAIKKLESSMENEESKALIIVMSDGYENSSSNFSKSDLAELIQEKQKTGKWTITYMGANQDLSKVSDDLNIDPSNMFSYDSTLDGTKFAFSTMSDSLRRYSQTGSSVGFYSTKEE